MKKVLGELSGGILDNEKGTITDVDWGKKVLKNETEFRLSVLESHYIALEERIAQLESRFR